MGRRLNPANFLLGVTASGCSGSARKAITLLVVCLVGLSEDAQGQFLDLSTISLCDGCAMQAHPVLFLGDASGEGVVESEAVQVRYSPTADMYAMFSIGGARIVLFDSTGTFVRVVGRRGEGPGEVSRLIDAQFRGADLVLLSDVGQKLLVMDVEGHLLQETRLSVRMGTFRVVSDSTLVVGSIDRRPELVGVPLHLVLLSSGQVVRHFGSGDEQWNVREPFAQLVQLGQSADATLVWWARPTRIHMEGWTTTGEQRLVVVGELSWFEPVTGARRDGSPPNYIDGFGLDGDGRFWLLTRVADPDWREVRPQGAEAFVSRRDYDQYWDTRIDVYDVGTERHLGTLRWNEAGAGKIGLVRVQGEFMLSKVVYTDDVVPRIALYRVDFLPRP